MGGRDAPEKLMPDMTVVIRNPSGLHARPAATFVKAAAGYPCEIRVTNVTRDAARSASAKSILGVMQLGVAQGHELRIQTSGEEEQRALDELVELVASGLGVLLPS
jgi:phosphotransferase system HPr (HPr) family protein